MSKLWWAECQQDLPNGCQWQHGNFQHLLELMSYAGRHGAFPMDPDVPFQIEPSPAAFEKLRARLAEKWTVSKLNHKNENCYRKKDMFQMPKRYVSNAGSHASYYSPKSSRFEKTMAELGKFNWYPAMWICHRATNCMQIITFWWFDECAKLKRISVVSNLVD